MVVKTLFVALENSSSTDGNICVVEDLAIKGGTFVLLREMSLSEDEEEDAYSSPGLLLAVKILFMKKRF